MAVTVLSPAVLLVLLLEAGAFAISIIAFLGHVGQENLLFKVKSGPIFALLALANLKFQSRSW